MFDFETEKLPSGIAVVSVKGALDDSNRAYFFGCVEDLIEDGFSRIIVDCDGLGHISSSGLAGLIRARSQAQAKGGKVYLTHVNATIAEVLNLTKLNKLLALYPTTKALLKKLSSTEHGGPALEPEG